MKRVKCLLAVFCAVSVIFAIALNLTPAYAKADIKEFVIGIGADADTLDPVASTTGIFINLLYYVCEGLFWLDADGNFVPRLATKIESSPDGLTFNLHLRKGVAFHDGSPFDAAAMKWNIDRLLNKEVRVPMRSQVKMLKGCSVVDSHTLELTLNHPFAPFDMLLGNILFAPISPAAAEKYGQNLPRHPVGAGPYEFVEWIPGERIVMVRNENYWGEKPAIQKIIWKIVPESTTREAMLLTGDMDLVYKPSPSNIAALNTNPAVRVAMLPTWRNVYMAMNCQKGVFKNKLVRQAFNYAVDAKTICNKILFDTAIPVEGPMSPEIFGFAKGEPQFDYNPEKAKQLLREADFDFNQTIHMSTCQGRLLFDKQISEAIQAYLQGIGVKVELRVFDWPTYVAMILKPLDQTQHQMSLLGWCPQYPDADNVHNGVFSTDTNPPKGLGIAFYSNNEFDELVKQSQGEQDRNNRRDLLMRASKIVWNDAPWIFLHREKIVVAYKNKYEGLILTPGEMFWTHSMTLAK